MISVYDIGNENFDKNGDAVLTPTITSVKQVAGGNYDLTMEHPIDAEGKWAHLVPGAIVKAPVPKEVIENSFSGVEADVYKVTTPAQLREDTIAPHAITYNNWSRSPSEVYEKGDKVSFDGENYEVQYYDGKSGETQIDPDKITWYKKIAKMTDGAPVLVSLNVGDELYYIEDANENWYKMSTFYGVVGYIPKAQVTYDRHVTPSESKPRIITDQLFRLQDPVVDNEKMTVKVTGQHVSYDLKGDLLKPISIYSAGPAMMMGIITGSLMYPYRGTVATNMSSADHGTYTGEIKGKNGMFALLDPDKGLVSHFDAKFTRDNWDLFVLEKEDTDRGYKIRYGVNARGISWKKSSANLVTRVVPVAKDEKGEDLYLPEVWIDSEDINDYPVIMMEQIKVEGQVGKAKDASGDETWTEEDLLDEMREKAEERFSIDHADQIYQEVTIQIELVEDTDEYAWLKGLKDLLLYDIVTAVDERPGLDKKLYVSELEYDSIREKITGIKLTNIQDYDVRTVTGYNVKNNSIGLEKLTDEVTRGLVNQAVNIMPQYADPNAKRTADNLNTKTADGIVLKGQGNANKVWGTDAQGNPGWVNPGSVDVPESGLFYAGTIDSRGGGDYLHTSVENAVIAFGLAHKSHSNMTGQFNVMASHPSSDLPSGNQWLNAAGYISAKFIDSSGIVEAGDVIMISYNTAEIAIKPIYNNSCGNWLIVSPSQYTLPLAANGTRGGVQIGYTQDGKNYPVQLSNEKMFVNVPWTADGGNAATVNSKTVEKNVPSNAVFTDTWKANSSSSEGYVASGANQLDKVWATDGNGAPAWRDVPGANTFNVGTVDSTRSPRTIAEAVTAFGTAHKYTNNVTGQFNCSSSNPPSDLPSQDAEWKYATGYISARYIDTSGVIDSGTVILYSSATKKIALNQIYNNALGTWEIISQGAIDGKVAKAGDAMTGNLSISRPTGNSSGMTALAKSGNTTVGSVFFGVGSDIINHGVWSNGYYDGSFHSSGKWMIYRNSAGEVVVNGTATGNAVIKSVAKTATTDANGFWKATISGIALFIGAKYTGSGDEPFIQLVSTKIASNQISLKLTSWNGTAMANKSVTLTVYYI